jgi:hypothetical protein
MPLPPDADVSGMSYIAIVLVVVGMCWFIVRFSPKRPG